MQEIQDLTLHGAEKWTHAMFKKLGWVAISDDNDMILNYKKAVSKLLESLKKSHGVYKDKDTKTQFVILYKKVVKLQKLIEKFEKCQSTF